MREIRLPDNVYFYHFLPGDPGMPPGGNNWLVPREGYEINTMFFYHCRLGKILYAQTKVTHAEMYSVIRRNHSHWPHYDDWFRGYVVGDVVYGRYAEKKKGQDKFIPPRTLKITGIGQLAGEGPAKIIRAFLIRLRSLAAIPGDYLVLLRRRRWGYIKDWWQKPCVAKMNR